MHDGVFWNFGAPVQLPQALSVRCPGSRHASSLLSFSLSSPARRAMIQDLDPSTTHPPFLKMPCVVWEPEGLWKQATGESWAGSSTGRLGSQ